MLAVSGKVSMHVYSTVCTSSPTPTPSISVAISRVALTCCEILERWLCYRLQMASHFKEDFLLLFYFFMQDHQRGNKALQYCPMWKKNIIAQCRNKALLSNVEKALLPNVETKHYCPMWKPELGVRSWIRVPAFLAF